MTRSNELTNFLNYRVLSNDPKLFRILVEKIITTHYYNSIEKENQHYYAHSTSASNINLLTALLTDPKKRAEILDQVLKLMISASFIDTERLFTE